MSDFTPTTAEVRQAYAAYMSSIQNPDWSFEPEFRSNQDRFDRWLKAHDAEVAAKAWDEGARSRQCRCEAWSAGECACGNYPSEANPYREAGR